MSDSPIRLGGSPAERVALGVQRWGEQRFVELCVELQRTMSWRDEPDLLSYIAGLHGRRFVEFGPGRQGYWLRTWPLRAFLYAWTDDAAPTVLAALADEHWRVREMAGKVAVRREIGEAADGAYRLLNDPIARVRAAAARVIGAVGEAEHADRLRQLTLDPDTAVADQAERALVTLAERLDADPNQLGR